MQNATPNVLPAGERPAGRRSLVPYLVGVLLLQCCLYLGMRSSSWFAGLGWRPGTVKAQDQVSRWRRATYDPRRDPTVGMYMPAVQLPAAAGPPVALVPPANKRTALVFVPDAGG